ncbi:MAG: NAD-dependent epimerase/dehydratase family protein [Corallococcus sp.]|nr:NAD-dependent epimerase/dehydratase family protein [Corallococcus sp.]
MKTIYCVTGAAGHLGNNLIRLLYARGEQIRAFVMRGENADMLSGMAQIYYGDTRDASSLEQFLTYDSQTEKICVIHAAAIISITEKYDKRVFDVNVEGTRNVVEACIRHNADKFVHVSSVHALEPLALKRGELLFDETKVTGNYAKSKAVATKYVLECAARDLNACVVLPSGIIGPNDFSDNHLNNLLKQYVAGKLPAAVKGEYDFVDVRDVAQAIVSAIEKGKRGKCYLVTNQIATIKNLLDYASNILCIRQMKRFLPIRVAAAFAPLCELHYRRKHKTPLFTKYSLKVLQSGDRFDNTATKTELGYNPRPLAETVADTVNWFVESGKICIGKNMFVKPSRKRRITTTNI